MTLKVVLAPGDGIGPEVMEPAVEVLRLVCEARGVGLELETILIGGAAYQDHGAPISQGHLKMAQDADAVLLGAVGGPQFDGVARHLRPEAGLLSLRKTLDTFANIRPAVCFDALLHSSTLKPDVLRGTDMVIVRELTAGVYFGQPRGEQTTEEGTTRVVDTQAYTRSEIERVVEVAFRLGLERRGVVHSVEKANVMETGHFWRTVVSEYHQADADFRDRLTLHHMYADNCAMQLVRAPTQFDVIVTDNLFGDILSDCAAMVTGSLGMLPSASLSRALPGGGFAGAIYEPVHGSAPDIAGTGRGNPLAMIQCVAMLLRYSLGDEFASKAVLGAVEGALNEGLRTPDIATEADRVVGCSEMGVAVKKWLQKGLEEAPTMP